MPNLTGKDFLIGAAVGYFLLPYIVKNAAGLLGKVKGDA
jgi:hypothetical protein